MYFFNYQPKHIPIKGSPVPPLVFLLSSALKLSLQAYCKSIEDLKQPLIQKKSPVPSVEQPKVDSEGKPETAKTIHNQEQELKDQKKQSKQNFNEKYEGPPGNSLSSCPETSAKVDRKEKDQRAPNKTKLIHRRNSFEKNPSPQLACKLYNLFNLDSIDLLERATLPEMINTTENLDKKRSNLLKRRLSSEDWAPISGKRPHRERKRMMKND